MNSGSLWIDSRESDTVRGQARKQAEMSKEPWALTQLRCLGC